MTEPADPQDPGARFDVARVLVWCAVVAVVAVLVAAALRLPARTKPESVPLPAIPPAGEFTDEGGPPTPPATGLFPIAVGRFLDEPAVERSGLELRTSEILGKWLVVDFVFSSCSGTCPRLQAEMKRLQAATAGATDLRFVSISVDPARDTPARLLEWADALGADRTRWLFLRLEEISVRRLMREGLKVPSADELIYHSNLFLLVAPDGSVRGRYEPLEWPNWMELLLADLAKLRAEGVR